MKIRTGFVSNSSSSSFMICLAAINDVMKFKEWIKRDKIILNSYGNVCMIDWEKIQEIIKISQNDDYYGYIDFDGDDFSLDATNEEYKVKLSYNKLMETLNNLPVHEKAKSLLLNTGYNIVYVFILNDEGDSDFSVYDREGEFSHLDYDIDLDFFSKDQQNLWNELKEENGLCLIDKKFGAARNG